METINENFDVSTSNGSVPLKVEITSKMIAIKWRYKNIFEKQFGFLPNKGGDTFVIQGTSFRVKWLRGGFNKVNSIVVTDLDDNILWMLNNDEANKIEVGVSTPWWAWIFILLCGLLFVLAGGGGIPALIGSVGALTCRSIARNPDKSTPTKLLQCLGITGGSWASTFAAITILFFILQPENTTLPWIDALDVFQRPISETRHIALTPDTGITLADTLESFGDEIIYQFAVTRGFAIDWQVIERSTDTRYRIIAPDGSEVKSSRMTINSSERILIEQTGTYQVHISNADDDEVEFEAQLWYVTPSEYENSQITETPSNVTYELQGTVENYQIIEIPSGEMVELRGTIEFPEQLQFYQIELGAIGSLYYQFPSSEPTSLEHSLSSMEFDLSTFYPLHNGLIRLQSPLYYLIIQDEDGATGDYALNIWHVPYPTPIIVSLGTESDSPNGIYEGIVDAPAQTFIYQFEVIDKPIRITALNVDGSQGLDWTLRERYDPQILDGGSIGANQVIIEALIRPRIYQLEVGLSAQNATGEFTLQIEYVE